MEIKTIQDVKSFLSNPDANIRSFMQNIATVSKTGDYDLTVNLTLSVVDALRGMVEYLQDCVHVAQENGYQDVANAIKYEKNRLAYVCSVVYPVCNEVRAGTKDLGDIQSAFETVVKDLISVHDMLTYIPVMITSMANESK